ncbi:MAG: two-component regulator propeller domain-containing protein [Paludibacter sp.]|nr:two-component regulator propeller domain-containing protein [Paludibacter sp.]
MKEFKSIHKLMAGLLMLFFSISQMWAGDEMFRFKHLTIDDGLPSNTIHSIIKDKHGFMWFATMNGLARYDGYSFKTFRSGAHSPDKPISNRPVSLALDKDSNLWISFLREYNEICKFNYSDEKFTRIKIKDADKDILQKLERNSLGNITKLENDSFKLEIAPLNLIQSNKRTGKKIIYKTDPTSKWSISDEFVLTMYVDNTNILWIGTDKGGVNYVQLNTPVFDFVEFNNISSSNFKESVIRSIMKDREGNVWLGTRNDGLIRIDASGVRKHFQKTNSPGSINDNRIRRLLEDKWGNIWVGVKGGLCRYLPKTGTFKTYNFDSDKSRKEDWVFSLFEDSKGNLWAGTWFGPAIYDPKNDRFNHFFNNDRKTLIRIRDIVEDHNKNIWIATEDNGLYKVRLIDTKNGRNIKYERFTNERDSTNSLLDNKLYCLAVDIAGKIWIGTENGLEILDPKKMKLTHFEENPLLREMLILGLVSKDSSLWVSHEHGVSQINCKTWHSRDFRKNNDFLGVEMSDGAYFIDKTGIIYFGGNRGYFTINPNQTPKNPKISNIMLTNLEISNKIINVNNIHDNRVILEKPLYMSKSIVLNWDERNIQIEFSAMFFSDPGSIRYAYRLKGLNNEWIYQDAKIRKAYFQNLQPGKYSFEVKAANSNGQWTEASTLQIVVLTPWWISWWAYLIYILIVSTVILLIFRYFLDRQKYLHEIKNEKEKAEKFREVDELKTKLVTNISHEFRTPLTLIIDPVEKLIVNFQNDENANKYLRVISKNAQKLLELVNQFLDLKKLESGNLKLNPEYRDFIQFLKSLTEYFEIQAKLHRIKFVFTSTEKKLDMMLDPDKMDKVILNLLNNAFKHTPEGGVIRLDLKVIDENVNICVSDTGEGIPENQLNYIFEPYYQVNQGEKNSSGIGLTFAKELVELHNGTISVESTLGTGTKFTILIPIKKPSEPDQQPIIEPYNSNSSHESENRIPTKQVKTKLLDKAKPIVLVAEDNSDVREYIVTTLKDKYNVIEAVNGLEGYENAVEIIPDLIISDLMMPEMDGMMFCQKAKTDERTSHIPFILLSAQHSEEVILNSYETGADAYITKPFSSSLLLVRVENMIETRNKLRKLFNMNTGFDTKIISVNGTDRIFMDKLKNLINERISETDFDVEVLSDKMNLSRTQLYRKVKAMTDMSVKEFITTIKMNKAAELILIGEHNIGQVAELVGESELSNFSRNFNKHFGISPSKYRDHFLKH